jgi:hypothetical protein
MELTADASGPCRFCGKSIEYTPVRRRVGHFSRRRFCDRACSDANRQDVPLSVRLWRKIATGAPDECWPWLAATTGNGYGVIWLGKEADANTLAHVAVYLDRIGPIPEGFQVDHLCRNTLCCNPVHLEAVTQLENLRRQAIAVKAERVTCRKGLHAWPEHLGVRAWGTRYCRPCLKASNHAAYLRRKAGRA